MENRGKKNKDNQEKKEEQQNMFPYKFLHIFNQANYCTCLVIQCFQQSQDPWKGTQEHHLPPCTIKEE